MSTEVKVMPSVVHERVFHTQSVGRIEMVDGHLHSFTLHVSMPNRTGKDRVKEVACVKIPDYRG